MFQKKGCDPEKVIPNFKMVIPVNTIVLNSIQEKLVELGIPVTIHIENYDFVYHRNGEIGAGRDYKDFMESNLPEMNFIGLLQYKEIPVQITIKEIEDLIGHQIKIIEESK